jgi:hypothetical protein
MCIMSPADPSLVQGLSLLQRRRRAEVRAVPLQEEWCRTAGASKEGGQAAAKDGGGKDKGCLEGGVEA